MSLHSNQYYMIMYKVRYIRIIVKIAFVLYLYMYLFIFYFFCYYSLSRSILIINSSSCPPGHKLANCKIQKTNKPQNNVGQSEMSQQFTRGLTLLLNSKKQKKQSCTVINIINTNDKQQLLLNRTNPGQWCIHVFLAQSLFQLHCV